jgi:hypothetical protein
MKTTAKLFMCCVAFFLVSNSTLAQKHSKAPRWLPENGNWMVETNIHKPLYSVIYFYTNEGEIIYKETLEGMKLNLDKKKVKMRLKKVLDAALVAWYKNKALVEEQSWVVNSFR